MYLVVDATFPLLYFEGTFITPRVAPGIHAEPILNSVFAAPTDYLDCVPAQRVTCGVLIHSRFISEEIIINSEGSSDAAKILEIMFYVIWAVYSIT